ncbi:MAG: SDR family oxidoreductase [Anaerolineae bacterium]|nr:SDR family oxidoreductase [Anaerolineae bacterium]MEB2367051.1 SDR family oxidoreductase [Chloroflexota bacterium]
MTQLADLRGKWAIVTGASSGLGEEFARQLAAAGIHLVLVARRKDRLAATARDLMQAHGIQTRVISADLSLPDTPQMIYDQLRADGIAVDVLINNAGFGLYGKFTDIAWEREQQMLDVDIATVVRMTRLFVPDMAARKSGWVLQVASVGAFLPSPLYASYSAAKAFVLSFSEAINFELRGTGVSVTTTCPGMIRTEFHDVSGQAYTWFQRLMLMEPEPCVRASINAMLRRKASVVPGRVNALMIWSLRLTPRWLMTAIAHRTMQPD